MAKRSLKSKTWDIANTLNVKFKAYCLKYELEGTVYNYCGNHDTGFRIESENAKIEYCPNTGVIRFFSGGVWVLDTKAPRNKEAESPVIQKAAIDSPFMYQFWCQYCEDANTVPTYVSDKLWKYINQYNELTYYESFNLYDNCFCICSSRSEEDYIWFNGDEMNTYESDLPIKFLYNILTVSLTQEKLNRRARQACIEHIRSEYSKDIFEKMYKEIKWIRP